MFLNHTYHTYLLSDNIGISFTDNGPPPNSDNYTTLVIFHGTAFNGYSLEKLHGFSHQLNLRTVIWNRREYPCSTPYSDSELEDLTKGRKIFMDRIGRQVCEFLLQFIEKEKIPKASDDLRRGGIAVMGWSIGACSAMALFSDADLVPRRTHAILEQYVKDLVLTDPPYLCFGFKMPDIRYYDTWTDPDLKTPQEKVQKFSVWVSSFFDHPNPDSGDVRDMDLTAKQGGNATVAKWTSKEFERYFSEGAAVRSDFPMYTEPMQTTLRELTEQVFYDESLIKSHFPHLKVTVVYGTRTTWRSLWGSKELQRSYDERLSKGMKARPLRSYKISGANHFLHWEDPKLLLEKVAEGIRGPNGTHFRGT